jgi:hypothetical protein
MRSLYIALVAIVIVLALVVCSGTQHEIKANNQDEQQVVDRRQLRSHFASKNLHTTYPTPEPTTNDDIKNEFDDDEFDDDLVEGDDIADDDEYKQRNVDSKEHVGKSIGEFLIPSTFGNMFGFNNKAKNQEKPKNCSYEFIYLPTTEGLVSQFNELRNFWSHVRLERHFYTVLHRSQHFTRVSWYSMCDIFDLGDAVQCINTTADDVVRAVGPNVCHRKEAPDTHKWLNDPISFNMEESNFNNDVAVVKNFHISRNGSMCVLGGPANVVDWATGPTFPLTFRPMFHDYLHQGKINLGIQHRETHRNVRSYMVVHWRRGDQLKSRCEPSSQHNVTDTSFNCGTAHELISEIKRVIKSGYLEGSSESQFFWREKARKKIPNHPNDKPIVYIATNQNLFLEEKGVPMHEMFTKAGMHTFKDLGLKHLNSLHRFVTELHMMIDSDFFMAWGPSSIHEFVRLAVDQKNNPHHHNYIRKRHPDEVRHCQGEMSVALKMTEGGQRLPKFPQLPSHLGS